MQAIAFSTPSHPDWRWRIINNAGETLEEAARGFPTIASAVADGNRRVREVYRNDESVPVNPFRRTAHLRRR